MILEMNDVTTRLRKYCDELMKRAGLVQISHEEGKKWEKDK